MLEEGGTLFRYLNIRVQTSIPLFYMCWNYRNNFSLAYISCIRVDADWLLDIMWKSQVCRDKMFV